MPFETLETITRENRPPQATISYERFQRKDRVARGEPRLMVFIPTTLAGLCKRDRFRFDLGTGIDAGRARISGLAKGVPGAGVAGSMMKNALRINFGFVPALGDEAAAGEKVNVRKIDDNTWEIDLPPWFKADAPKDTRKSA